MLAPSSRFFGGHDERHRAWQAASTAASSKAEGDILETLMGQKRHRLPPVSTFHGAHEARHLAWQAGGSLETERLDPGVEGMVAAGKTAQGPPAAVQSSSGCGSSGCGSKVVGTRRSTPMGVVGAGALSLDQRFMNDAGARRSTTADRRHMPLQASALTMRDRDRTALPSSTRRRAPPTSRDLASRDLAEGSGGWHSQECSCHFSELAYGDPCPGSISPDSIVIDVVGWVFVGNQCVPLYICEDRQTLCDCRAWGYDFTTMNSVCSSNGGYWNAGAGYRYNEDTMDCEPWVECIDGTVLYWYDFASLASGVPACSDGVAVEDSTMGPPTDYAQPLCAGDCADALRDYMDQYFAYQNFCGNFVACATTSGCDPSRIFGILLNVFEALRNHWDLVRVACPHMVYGSAIEPYDCVRQHFEFTHPGGVVI